MLTILLLAVAAALAAAAAPYLVQINDVARVNETSDLLHAVAAGVDSFNLTAKRGGPAFTTPNRLSQLTTTIVDAQPAGCTTLTYNATAVAGWLSGAPFVAMWMPTNGLWTPLGRLNDAPSRTAATAATARTSTSDPYFIQIAGVDVDLARMLDLAVDGVANSAADTVQYTAPAADGTVLLSFNVFPAHLPAC
jgi:type II secretory pathway pseudopilin PulG